MALPALKFTINTARDVDPTRTIILRGQFISQVNKRFRELKGAINRLLIDGNFLEPTKPTEYQPGITLIGLAAQYEYLRSDVKVDQFMDWLRDQENQGILEIFQRPGGLRRGQSQAWSDVYIQSSYQKGIAQARADLRVAGADIPSFQSIPGGVAGVFNQPFHADRVALIYTRCFNEMEGITEAMNGHLSRELALGMAQGQSPYAIAKRINERVDNIGIVRGRLIARTEIVQAHNEAALNEYERAEIEIGEPVKVEWVAVMDDRVRSHHAARNGKIYDRGVAREMLGEPNCRCGLAPWVKSLQEEVPVKKAPMKKAPLVAKIQDASQLSKSQVKALETLQFFEDDPRLTFEMFEDRLTHERLNSDLRNKKILYRRLSAKQIKMVDKLDEAFVSAKGTTADMTLYRGADFYRFVDESTPSFIDRGFLSTTTDKAKALEFTPGKYVARIKIPKGAKGVNMTKLNAGDYAPEKEILFSRGGKLKVTGVSMEGKIRFVDLEFTQVERLLKEE